MRIVTIIAACAVAVNVAIWATVCLATGDFIHPWWLYVVAPPGAILGVSTPRGSVARNPDPPTASGRGTSPLSYRA